MYIKELPLNEFTTYCENNKVNSYRQTLEYALYEMQKYKTSVSLQLANNPRFYLDVELEDNIDRIISMIKNYYEKGELKYVQ